MSTVALRLCRAEEFPELAKIERAAGALFPSGRIPDPEATLAVEVLRRSLDDSALLVAEAGERLAAFAAAEVIDGYLHLHEISVHPDFARRGVGAQLIGRLRRLAVDRQLTGVSLTTFADLPWNGPYYARLGFEEVGGDAMLNHLEVALADEVAAGLTLRVAMLALS